MFEKLPVMSLYWFDVQQQTSTLIGQKYVFYLKLNVELNELIPSFQKELQVTQKLQKANKV